MTRSWSGPVGTGRAVTPDGLHDAAHSTKTIKMTYESRSVPGFADLRNEFSPRPNSVAQMPQGKIFAISATTNRVYLIDSYTGIIGPVATQSQSAVCLASSGEFLALAGSDSVLYIYRNDDLGTPVSSMPTYRDSISCAALSGTFFVAVIGTRDGSLIINSINKTATVRVIDLKGGRPALVCVTSGWGFIVTYVTKLKEGKLLHYLYVFNVNGRRLRKKKLDLEVSAWFAWTSPKGFDYMVISDPRGKLFAFEVFYGEIGEAFFRCHSPVSTITYVADIGCVVAVATNGQLIFVPHHIVDQ
jgi:WD40 repeat protein